MTQLSKYKSSCPFKFSVTSEPAAGARVLVARLSSSPGTRAEESIDSSWAAKQQ